jgi:putative methionine-R-sulfoxide reductase with GAF domain
MAAKYAYFSAENPPDFLLGEGLSGQVAKNQKALRINDIPETHLNIVSGLGKGKPKNIIIFPILFDEELFGIIELASFINFSEHFEDELTGFFNNNSDKFLNIDDK